jgi:hypothetical protein
MRRRGDTLAAPAIVSDRLFLSGLLASMARLRFTGWEPSSGGEERLVNRGAEGERGQKRRVSDSWSPSVGLVCDWNSRQTLGEETSHSAQS